MERPRTYREGGLARQDKGFGGFSAAVKGFPGGTLGNQTFDLFDADLMKRRRPGEFAASHEARGTVRAPLRAGRKRRV